MVANKDSPSPSVIHVLLGFFFFLPFVHDRPCHNNRWLLVWFMYQRCCCLEKSPSRRDCKDCKFCLTGVDGHWLDDVMPHYIRKRLEILQCASTWKKLALRAVRFFSAAESLLHKEIGACVLNSCLYLWFEYIDHTADGSVWQAARWLQLYSPFVFNRAPGESQVSVLHTHNPSEHGYTSAS